MTALWLLGRVPAALLAPWTLLRPGRAGRGPGPDVREAACALPAGIVRAGDVEVHLRASDWARHGHATDPAYGGVLLHLVWTDDRPAAGGPLALPGGGSARTLAVGPALGHDPARLRALLRRGPATVEPCAQAATALGAARVATHLRQAGQQRLAERAWRAAHLVAEQGREAAWSTLLERALRASAGRRVEGAERRAWLVARIDDALGEEPLQALAALARAGRPGIMVQALQGADSAGHHALGPARAAEIGWNAALPLLAALAAAYDDVALARSVAALAAAWPAPRPYGRTRALAGLLHSGAPPGGGATRPVAGARLRAHPGAPPSGGALAAQGLLHTQELWCERGGCGVCPLSGAPAPLHS